MSGDEVQNVSETDAAYEASGSEWSPWNRATQPSKAVDLSKTPQRTRRL